MFGAEDAIGTSGKIEGEGFNGYARRNDFNDDCNDFKSEEEYNGESGKKKLQSASQLLRGRAGKAIIRSHILTFV